MEFRFLNGALRHVAVAFGLLVSVANPPAMALEVSLTGPIDDELRGLLEGGSLLFEQAEEASDVTPQEIVSVAQADYKRLLAVLYDQGFFSPVIRITLDGREATSVQSVNPPPSVSNAAIEVEPGEKFRFGNVQVTPLAPGTSLPDGFASGETARLGILRTVVNETTDAWRDQGHAKARLVSQKITARHSEREINADLLIDPGQRYRFGPLTVTGNEAVRSERIHEIAGLPEGEVFSPDALEKSASRLRRTGAFGAVAMIEEQDPGSDEALDITARVTEAKPRRFGFGAELGTLEGLTLSAFWMHRNLFGGAERLRVEGEIEGIGGDTGGTDARFAVRYERPATFNADTNFYALTELEQLDEIGFFSRQATIEAGIERFASDERSYRLGVGARRANTRDAFGDNQYTLLLLPLGVTFDYRDRELDARRGYYADVETTPFLAVSGADNGVLTTADLRGYKSFGPDKRTTFALRLQLGSLAGPDLNVAPADFLFYSGGGGTVRGHDFQSLGVDVGGGQEVGGRSFVGLSAEMRFRSAGALGFVGFIDAGYIGEEEFPDGSGEWQSGAGVGLRYDTPIGPIRFDVGTATSGDDDAAAFQIYIGIGQSF